MARKVVRMPLPRPRRALEDVRIKNAAVAPTIVVDRRSERSPSQLGFARKVDLVHQPLHVGHVETPCMHFVHSRPPLSSVTV
jgi:hypothetical protein